MFWFIKIPQKQSVNEMEQEEQEDEYINEFDFLKNFVLTLIRFAKLLETLFCFILR